MSKLPKPMNTNLRTPQLNELGVLPINKANKELVVPTIRTTTSKPLIALPQRRLGRRSKSVTDLRSIDTRTVKKRPADGNSNDVGKPKIKKIPDWDYKGRFSQLQEKHNILTKNYKEIKDNLADFSDMCVKYTALQEEISILHKDRNDLKKECQVLQQKDVENLKQIEKLSGLYKQLCVENNNVKTKLDVVEAENRTLYSKNQQADNHISILENKVEDLEKKYVEQQNLVMKLKDELYSSNEERRRLHNNIQDLKGNIRVFCRIRPPIDSETDRLQCHLKFIDEISLEIRRYISNAGISQINCIDKNSGGVFTFDKVFTPESTQHEIFEDLTQLVQSALDGYNVCVFAYGQTGSGKTYTMQGKDELENLGMIPRTIDLIFRKIKQLKNLGWQYKVQASFLEIYNENVRDLLNYTNNNQKLDIHFNEGRGTTVTNLTIKDTNTAEELTSSMILALKNRATEATYFNEHSSRSHAVTKIYLQGICEDNNSVYTGSINLVDLAGSESAKTATNERLTETKNINKSLSTLGDVMLALHNKSKHIPYRNSKLTYLLQSSLGGNSKTLMIVNIAPFEECFSESINSLRFASKVKEVKTGLKRNKTVLIPPTTPKL